MKSSPKLIREADEEVWRFQLTLKLPNHLAIRTGEIFHNLADIVLDQMLAEIVARVSETDPENGR